MNNMFMDLDTICAKKCYNTKLVFSIFLLACLSFSTAKAQFGTSPYNAPSGTYTVPAGVTSITVTCYGGGGGGGGGKSTANAGYVDCGGGGGGAATVTTVSVAPGTSIAVVVGTGGAAGVNTGGNGGPGVASSVTLVSTSAILASAAGGNGGGGGTASSAATSSMQMGGTGGTTGTGSIEGGGTGGTGFDNASYDVGGGGGGGGGITSAGSNGATATNASPAGTGGAGGAGNTGTGTGKGGLGGYGSGTAGAIGTTYGGGGGGASIYGKIGAAGGAGAAGAVIITYTAATVYTSVANSDWNTGSTWNTGTVPPAGATCVVNTAVTLGAALTNTGSITINSGASLTTTASITNSGTFTVNGTFQMNPGGYASGTSFVYGTTGSTLVFNNTSLYGISSGQAFWPVTSPPYNVTVSGSGAQTNMAVGVVAGTMTLNAQMQMSTAVTINGTLQLNSGGYVSTNPPTYGSASYLVYNTSYGVGTEWTGNGTTAGSGIPQNITVQNSATLTMTTSNRGLAGNLNITSGGLVLNSSSGDIYVGGNWTRASGTTFTPNGRAVFFDGSTTQVMTCLATGGESFNYLLVSGSGTLQLASAAAVTYGSGLTLSSTNATSTIDLNGQTLTYSGGGNLSLGSGNRYITSTLTGGIFKVPTFTTVTSGGTLTFGTTSAAYTTLELSNGFDCGSGNLTTVNNNLQLDAGGYISNDAPKYGAISYLIYNSTGTYGTGAEWTSNTTTTAGTGTPQNVTIQNSTTVALSAINHAMAGNLNVISGGLTIYSGASYDLYIGGNWTRAASTTFTPGARGVYLSSATAKTITVSGGETFYNLYIQGGGNVTLASAATVSNTLTLTSGLLILGANNLTLSAASTGGSTTSYIVTNSTTGSVIQTTTSSATTIPIGASTTTTTFAPVTITGASTYTCSVSTTVPGTPINTATIVNMAWSIVSSSAISSSVSFQWNAANDAASFVATSPCDLGIYNGSAYTVSTPWTPTGTSPTYTLAVTGLAIPGSGTNKCVIGNTGSFVCTTASIPYTENFDGSNTTAPALPICWTYLDVDGDGFHWQTNNSSSTFPPPSGGSSPNAIFCRYDASAANNDWAFSKGINLAASTMYKVSFLYAAESASFVENLSVSCGTSQTVAGMTISIGSETSFSNTTYATATFTFTSGAAGVYYFGLHDYSIANQYGIFVDNFSVINFTPVNYTWTGTTNSDWGTATNWSPNGIPSSIDNVTIPTTTNPCIVGASAYSVGTVATTTAGTFQMASGSTLTINGAISFGSSVTPAFACSSTLNLASTSSITVPAFNYGSLNLTGGARVLASSGSVGICNTFTPGTGTFTNTGSSINYYGTGTQTVTAFNYNNLTITGPRTTTANAITWPSGIVDVAATFTPPSSFASAGVVITSATASIFNFSGGAGQAIPAFYYGSITDYNVGTSTNTAATRTWASSGVIDINGTFSPSTGVNTITGSTIRYSSTAGTTYSLGNNSTNIAGYDYNNLSFSGASLFQQAVGANLGVYGNDSITGGAIEYVCNNTTGDPNSLNINGSLILNASSLYVSAKKAAGTLTVAGNVNNAGGGIAVAAGTSAAGTGSMTITGASSAFTNNGNLFLIYSGAAPGSLTMSGTSSSFTMGAGGTLYMNYGASATTTSLPTASFAGSVSLSGGTLDFAPNTATYPGTITINGALSLSGAVTLNTTSAYAANGTIIFNGTTQALNATGWTGNSGYVNYTINSPSIVTLGSNFNFAGGELGIFTVSSGGTLNFGGTNYLSDASGYGTFTNNGTLIIGSPNGITSGTAASGNVQSTGTRTYATTGNYTYAGTTSAQAVGTGLPATVNNLTIANTASSGVVQMISNTTATPTATTINGNLIFTSGSLDLNGNNNITLSGTSSISGENCSTASTLINSQSTNSNNATNGWIGITRTLAASPGNVANLGITFTSTAAAMGATTIKRFPKAVTAINTLDNSIKRIYSVTPATASGAISATYSYCTSELNGNTDGILGTYYSTGTNETVAGSYGLTSTVSDVNPIVTSDQVIAGGVTTYITLADPDKYCTVNNTDWNTGSTWITGTVPPAGANICINNAITVNSVSTSNTGNITLNSGGSITNIASGLSVNVGTGSTFTNSSGVAATIGGAGAVTFTNGGAIAGAKATTFTNLTLTAGTLTIPTSNIPVISGTLTISGGNVSNPPIYGSSSTLEYNVTYNRFVEWSAGTGGTLGTTPGYPNNVTVNTGTLSLYNSGNVTVPAIAGLMQINSGATVNMTGLASGYPLNVGSMTINSGGTMSMGSATAPVNVSTNMINNGTLTQSTASLGDIYLAGNWTRGSSAVYTPNGRAVFLNGTGTQVITVTGGGTETFNYLFVNGSGTMQLASGTNATNVAVNSSGGLSLGSTNSTSTIDLNGQTMTLSGGGNLSLSSGSRYITSTISGGIMKITGSLTSISNYGTLAFASNTVLDLQNGFNFAWTGSAGVTTVNGTLEIDGGGYVSTYAPIYGTGSVLNYNGVSGYTAGQEWYENTYSEPGVPYNVTLTNNASVNFTGEGYQHEMWGNLTINSGASLSLAASGSTPSPDLYIKGNWINNGTFNCNGHLVQFLGTSAQTLTGATTFDYLQMNNSTGLTLSNNATVNTQLILTSGIITTGSNTVTVNSTSATAVTGYGSTNYVYGNLQRYVASSTSYDFPVGTASNYELANVTFASGLTGTTNLTANFTAGSTTAPIPGTCVINGTAMSGILNAGYWTIHPDMQPAAGTYTATLNLIGATNLPSSYPGYTSGGASMTITPAMQLGLIKRTSSSTSWLGCGDMTYNNAGTYQTGLGSTTTVGGTISGATVTVTRTGVSSFSDFGIGTEQNQTYALPVQLIYFTAEASGSNAQLNWATASEINNAYFAIERSTDGSNFTQIGQAAGQGTTTVTTDYSYSDPNISEYGVPVLYYRLKQVDADGNFTYTNIASVTVADAQPVFHIISTFPDPFSDHVSVSFYSPSLQPVTMSVYDVRGALVSEETINGAEGMNVYAIPNTSRMASGFYSISVKAGDQSFGIKMMKTE